MKSKDWIDIYKKDNPKGFIAICQSGRHDLLTYWYKTKEEAESSMKGFTERTGCKCLAIVENE